MRISDWSSDVCSSDLAIRRDVEICASVVAPSPGREQPCDADGVAFSSFRHGVLRARVDEPSNCERRCGHLGWDIECSQDLGQMDRLYLEPSSEERREGKACVSQCGSRGLPDDNKKKQKIKK